MTAAPDLTPAALEALDKAVREFNAWRFYDCHETLEDAWRDLGGKAGNVADGFSLPPGGVEATDALRPADFYQGVIKVAAGFHHVLRDNHKGAVNLLSDALRLLDPFRPAYLGIDVDRLHAEVRACLKRINALGPARLREFGRGAIPRIDYAGAAAARPGSAPRGRR